MSEIKRITLKLENDLWKKTNTSKGRSKRSLQSEIEHILELYLTPSKKKTNTLKDDVFVEINEISSRLNSIQKLINSIDNSSLSEDEKKLVGLFRSLPKGKQKIIFISLSEMIKALK